MPSLAADYARAWRLFARLARDPKRNPSAARLRDHMRQRLIEALDE